MSKLADEIFKIINENVIKRLEEKGDITLPKKKISVPKDEAWNTKQMSSILLQGLLNGDGIPQISKALGSVIGDNEASQIRNARTMVTGAENRGRLDSYKELQDNGVVMKKVWMATPDDRTRKSHMEIDGEEVDPEDEFSNGCEYPGDPAGPPNEVWNCRCSMRSHIVGFKKKDGKVSKVNYERDTTIHDEQMAAEKAKRGMDIITPIQRVTSWGFHGKDKNSDEKVNDLLELAGIDKMDGEGIFADTRTIERRDYFDYRVKLHDETHEVEIILYNEDDVYIDLIAVKNKGQGEGTKLLNEIKEQAIKRGYSKLTAYAAGDGSGASGYNGYYSLARFGFDGEIPKNLADKADKLFGAKTIQDIMKTEEGRKWWKKNGTGFEATLLLKPRR